MPARGPITSTSPSPTSTGRSPSIRGFSARSASRRTRYPTYREHRGGRVPPLRRPVPRPAACGRRRASVLRRRDRAHRSSPLSGRPTRTVSEATYRDPTATRSASEVLRSRRGSSPPRASDPRAAGLGALGRPPVRWRYHPSRIFQKLSLRTILPSSPNVHRSHPRTSTRTPSVVVPLIVHSETPDSRTRSDRRPHSGRPGCPQSAPQARDAPRPFQRSVVPIVRAPAGPRIRSPRRSTT